MKRIEVIMEKFGVFCRVWRFCLDILLKSKLVLTIAVMRNLI